MKKPYIIGETAYNHQGDFNYLKTMILDIKEVGLNAIKFHLLLDSYSYFQKKHPLAEDIKKWMFTKEQWNEAFELCTKNHLDIIALCDDLESIQYINDNHRYIKGIELHASSLNEYYMLKEVLNFPNLIILGIGGSSLDEIDFAVQFLKNNGRDDILLMYGFQSYPTNYEDINLSKILKLRDLFNVKVGYADHTAFDSKENVEISVLPSAMGINVLEKHYTPDVGQTRLDYHAAVGREQMKAIIEKMERNLKVFGAGSMELTDAEVKYGVIGPMKKAIVAKCFIKAGDILTLDKLCFKRTEKETFLMQKELLSLIGLKAKVDILEDEIIDYFKIEDKFNKGSYSKLTGGVGREK